MTETIAAQPPSAALALRSLLRADTAAQLRNRQALLLSFVLPVAMLLITGLAGGGKARVDAVDPGFFIGLSMTYGLMASCMLGYPIQVARDREAGVFQRMRVTPVPLWAISVSRLVVQLVTCFVMAVVVMAIGGVQHRLRYTVADWGLMLAISVLGAAVFLAIGQAIVGLSSTSGEVNAVGRVLMVLLIVVGLIGSSGLMGTTLQAVGLWTPVGALTNLYAVATGSVGWGGDQWKGLVSSLVYLAAGAFVGVRWFRWTVR